jgi:hypothetical protein
MLILILILLLALMLQGLQRREDFRRPLAPSPVRAGSRRAGGN